MNISKLFAIIALLPALANATGSTYQSHQSIKAVAEDFARASVAGDYDDIRANATALDNRLRLRACSQPVEAFSPASGRMTGSTTVGVRCADQQPWTVYVRVNVRVFGPVVVTAQTLPRDTVIAETDLTIEQREISALGRGVITEPEDAIGKILKRALPRNAVLQPGQLKVQRLVYRGKEVSLIAASGGLEIHMRGKALADGGHGDQIRVKNSTSNKIVEGTVTGLGQVQVSL